MRLASLAMYVAPPPVAAATAMFWNFIRNSLREEGLTAVPDSLDDTVRYNEAWIHPDLLLSQTCG